MDLIATTRSLVLPTYVERAWEAIASAEGLAAWLGDEVDLAAVLPGAAGAVVDGGVARRVVVTGVEEGRLVRFAWWDEAAPELASTVELRVEAEGDGSRVTVTEQVLGAAKASVAVASVDDLHLDVGAPWDRRLHALLGVVREPVGLLV